MGDGWTEGRVLETWKADKYNRSDPNTWPKIAWTHDLWYTRRGDKLDVSKLHLVTQRVPAQQIRPKTAAPKGPVQLTLFHIRWGGGEQVRPAHGGAGGWGDIGSTPSDHYINTFEDHLFEKIGPTYEIYSIFVQGSEDLALPNANLLRHIARGDKLGALYFLWPIYFQDGHNYPAYVDREKLWTLMVSMEAAGIPTRFPHSSNLYDLYASKEWTSQMCLHPLFPVPLTTKVSRQAIAMDPKKAASDTLQALANLKQTRDSFGTQTGQKPVVGRIDRGVAKLGYSWEALDVRAWKNETELARALTVIGEQAGSRMGVVLVQELIDFDVEMRMFVVDPNLSDPSTLKPKKVLYTVFTNKENGTFSSFAKYNRSHCLETTFENDDEALTDAEQQSYELVSRWLQWLQAQTHELPVVTRFDILAKRTAKGRAAITTMELTEMGACFLGW